MLKLAVLFIAFLFISDNGFTRPPTTEEIQKARIHFQNGINLGSNNNYEPAIAEFEKAITLNPLYAEAFMYLGVAKIETGNYQMAVSNLTKAIELDPRYSDQAYYFRGLAKYYLEDYPGSISDLSIAIRLNPDFIGFFQRGKANLRLREYRRALQDFQISLRLNPNYHPVYLYRGINFYYLDNLEMAIADLDTAKLLLPENALAFYYSGLARTEIRNSYVAIEDLDKAIGLDPSFAAAFNARAIAKSNIGHHESAANDRQQAVLLNQQRDNEHELGGKTQINEPADSVIAANVLQDRPTSATDINFGQIFGERRATSNGVTQQADITQNQQQPIEDVTPRPIALSTPTPQVNNVLPEGIEMLPVGIYSLTLQQIRPRGFGVQVASYTNTQNLVRLAEAYADKFGVRAVISIAMVNNRKFYRLILGDLPDRPGAERFRDTLRNQGFPDAHIVIFDNL